MTQTVAVPLWLLGLLVALAVFAALEWFLLPGVRWYLRRKVRRVMDEISARFKIELPEFKLTRRRALLDRLTSDPLVLAAAERHAAESATPRAVVVQRIHRYAAEIVPAFNAYVYFRVGYWLAKTFAKMTYRVRLGYTDTAALAAIEPSSTVVFVMNHRSNMDYVLVSFLAAERVALSYAVGEWARIWPLQGLIRAMGAYFVRRNSGDPLYRMVLQRYVQMATEGGVPQAMYPEGGLTTDGRLRSPKLGLLDYMLKGFDPKGAARCRLHSGRHQLRPRPRGSLAAASRRPVGSQGRPRPDAGDDGALPRPPAVCSALRGRRYRNGYACVNFGTPLSMRDYVAAQSLDFRALDDVARRPAIAAVGALLMAKIGAVVPSCRCRSWPACCFAIRPRAHSELELKAAVQALMQARRRRRERMSTCRAPTATMR